MEIVSQGFETEEESFVNSWLIVEVMVLGCCMFRTDGILGVLSFGERGWPRRVGSESWSGPEMKLGP